MLTPQVREFLQKPLVSRMSVIDPNGFPHTVPVWHATDGDDIVIISERGTRKIGYLAANPKGNLCVGGDTNDGEGYLIKGTYTAEEDPRSVWMRRLVDKYEPAERAASVFEDWKQNLDIIVLRLKITRVIKVA